MRNMASLFGYKLIISSDIFLFDIFKISSKCLPVKDEYCVFLFMPGKRKPNLGDIKNTEKLDDILKFLPI